MSVPGERATGMEAVLGLVRRRAGLALPAGHLCDVEARVQRAMRRAGTADFEGYLELLRHGGGAFEDLVGELTVGETYFFRDRSHFDFLRQRALPELLGQRGEGAPLRVWSAGCASGEEAYSLAIVLEEMGLAERARIFGSDISRPALVRAREAVYGQWSLRGVEEATLQRHFRAVEGSWALAERHRRRVAFFALNLAGERYPAPAGPGEMDLILCRNVLIYFDMAAVEHAARRLFATLAPGGWLIAGPSDPLLAPAAPFEMVTTDAGVFYRRPRAASALVHEAAPAVARASEVEVAALEVRAATGAGAAGAAAAGGVVAAGGDALAAARAALAAGDYGPALELAGGVAGPAAAALAIRARANRDGSHAAAKHAAEAAQRHPLSADLHLLHALLLLETGRAGEATSAVRRALYLDRSLAPAHFLLGVLLGAAGDASGARRAYGTAAALAGAQEPGEALALFEGVPASQLAAAARAALTAARPR